MANWEELYDDDHDRMEMLQVADGYLLRNWVRSGSDGTATQVALVFIVGSLPAAPVVVDAPAAYPTDAKVGDMLTCTMGNWQGVPLQYEYTWRRGDVMVGVENVYAVTPEDAGQSLVCNVTARNAGGETEAASNTVTVAA